MITPFVVWFCPPIHTNHLFVGLIFPTFFLFLQLLFESFQSTFLFPFIILKVDFLFIFISCWVFFHDLHPIALLSQLFILELLEDPFWSPQWILFLSLDYNSSTISYSNPKLWTIFVLFHTTLEFFWRIGHRLHNPTRRKIIPFL